jgi:predicted enzyme related to lactoylglutathione lyase
VAAIELVLDCADLDAQATFWAAALGYVSRGAAGQYRALMPAEGQPGPALILQRVDEPRVTKNRMHLDIMTADLDTEVARLEALGARRARDPIDEHGHRWIPMTDPEGNEFCICVC